NDHVAKIMGYGDYQIGNVTISWVYCVEGLGHNLFSVGQFCDLDLEVAFCQYTCFICNLDRVDLLTGSRGNNLYTLSLQDMMASSPICLLSKASKTKSWLWHRRLSHLNFGASNHLARQGLVRGLSKLKFEKTTSVRHVLWAKRLWQPHVLPKIDPSFAFDIERNHMSFCIANHLTYHFFHVFGALCYPTNDSDNLGKLQPKADIGIFIGYVPTKKAFRIYNRRSRRIVEIIHVDFDELTAMASEHRSSDLLFQLMFDELLNPPSSVDHQAAQVIAPIAEVIPQVQDDSTGSPSSTMVDQDAPSAISTRLQLYEQALFCYYDAFLTSVEPKTYKEALTQSCWIEAMQEELNEFERLEVWELVPRPDKVMEKQEVKNVVEQPAERRTRIIESLQNFRVIHKSSISLNNTSQISPVHAITPILSTKEPEYLPGMGYEHPNTTPEMESDEIIKSDVEELVPILSENEVTSEDMRECDMLVCENSPICDDHSEIFSKKDKDEQSLTLKCGVENSVFDQEGDILFLERLLSEELRQLPPMNPNQAKSSIEEPEHSFSMGESIEPIKDGSPAFTTSTNLLFSDSNDFTSNDKESIHDVPIEESKVFLNPLFDEDKINSDELESYVESNFVESLSNHDHLKEFSRPLMYIHIAEEERIRREHAEYISRMEMLFTMNPCPRLTMNANTIVESFPSSLIPVQDNELQREEIDIVTNTDDVLPPGFENDDSEGEIDAAEELHVDNFISNSENKLSDNEESDFDNPSFLRPPPEPPDADFKPDSGEEISVVMNTIDELKCLDRRDEFDDDDYSSFMFVIYSKVFSFLLSAESEDTIFDPGISV
nr:integrase, catalytic region, zinc finger, CCHC-type, peptidase aspartic, catalytic [Tanacetum cinerariifolium]